MLQVDNVCKKFRNTPALQGVSLQVEQGETVVLMGPSGCGKSTLIRCINRLAEPDSGDITFGGRSVLAMDSAELLDYRRRIGFVFQHFNLINRLSILENTALGLVMAGMERNAALDAARAALLKVGIGAEMWERAPAQLSGGQRQRVGIARALSGRPDLMLWDEPTASLDPILVQEVLEVMEGLAAESHAGMLVVTHEISFAMRAADRILLMDQGRIVEAGSPGQILQAPTSTIGLRYQKLWRVRYTELPLRTAAYAHKSITRPLSGGSMPSAQKMVEVQQ